MISSPLVRARQTARIVATLYSLEPRQSVTLAPGMDYAKALRHAVDTGGHRVALVGHEPDLGRFACWLLGGEAGRCMPLRKGGACAIEFAREPGPAAGRLRWLPLARRTGNPWIIILFWQTARKPAVPSAISPPPPSTNCPRTTGPATSASSRT